MYGDLFNILHCTYSASTKAFLRPYYATHRIKTESRHKDHGSQKHTHTADRAKHTPGTIERRTWEACTRALSLLYHRARRTKTSSLARSARVRAACTRRFIARSANRGPSSLLVHGPFRHHPRRVPVSRNVCSRKTRGEPSAAVVNRVGSLPRRQAFASRRERDRGKRSFRTCMLQVVPVQVFRISCADLCFVVNTTRPVFSPGGTEG